MVIFVVAIPITIPCGPCAQEAAQDGPDTYYASVDWLEDGRLRSLPAEDLLKRLPADYDHSFLLVIDNLTTQRHEFPILVIDLVVQPGRVFRAVPSQIQSIENNLSIANMDFRDFADSVDSDGIFRGFST
ncbi:MAG: hypothetical protein K2Q23_02130 [Bryobacteraceae bacterium]|nr:hypothetical protein [Bryobacteraceae bacterium]